MAQANHTAFQVCNVDALLDILKSAVVVEQAEQGQLLHGLNGALSDFGTHGVKCESHESTACIQPRDQADCELQRELMQTLVILECKRSQLTSTHKQLQKALEIRNCQESCLRQREQDVLDMKLKLALCRQRTQHDIEENTEKDNKANNDLLSVNAKLEVYHELLQQKQEELNKCEEHVLDLVATEKDLCTQMSEHQRQLGICRTQRSSSAAQGSTHSHRGPQCSLPGPSAT